MIDVIRFTTSSRDYYSTLKIRISPQLTKLNYEYLPSNISAPVVVFKNIDYTTLYTYDINFIDQDKYLETVRDASNNQMNSTPFYQMNNSGFHSAYFILEDNYLIVRNDSVGNGT